MLANPAHSWGGKQASKPLSLPKSAKPSDSSSQERRDALWEPCYLAMKERGFSTPAAFVALGREAVARERSETRSKGLHHAAHATHATQVAARYRGVVLRRGHSVAVSSIS
jgi:hypothetical protein